MFNLKWKNFKKIDNAFELKRFGLTVYLRSQISVNLLLIQGTDIPVVEAAPLLLVRVHFNRGYGLGPHMLS